MSSGPNIPRSQRKRRPLEITLSDGARAYLEYMAEDMGISLSAVVEMLLADTAERVSDRSPYRVGWPILTAKPVTKKRARPNR